MYSASRRGFVQTLAGGAALAALGRPAFGQDALKATKLTDRIWLISGAGNNVVVAASPDGVMMVDSGDAAHAAELQKLIASETKQSKVQTLFNTHWHLNSTGGNDTFAKAGATIVAHMNTKLWMTIEVAQEWSNKTFPPRAKEAWPTKAFYNNDKTTFAGEPVEYGLLPQAHTDGDIYVFFRQSNVLVAGDAVQPGRLPVLDYTTDGWIGGMLQAQRTLLELANDSTKIVPAQGGPITKAELQAHFDILTKLRDQLVKLMKSGKGARDMIEAKATKDFDDVLKGDPEQFLFNTYRGLWAHVRELGGIV